ncbi:hypothetical protein J8I29_12760 [Labrys sp. LIt4]|uniref:hypothetical protein n=1 Tax=Labrys sp. LIt4 TaxID=2821355 RepID=UPI001ADEFFFE|nr:hypothetical protein [Labrys sp. LIt4]MBP0580186.1 hypothetical protein [Labrys sp. LIt4]
MAENRPSRSTTIPGFRARLAAAISKPLSKPIARAGGLSSLAAVAILAAAPLFPAGPVLRAETTADLESKAVVAWGQIAAVLEHPRCLNCHQATVPLQGDSRRVHVPLVVRGPDNHGVGAMRCGNCHNAMSNNETSGTPGAGHAGLWQLAPISMLWQGLSSRELCEMLKDKTRNGNRDGAALIEHMEHEPLVQWGWHPGGTRQPVPMAHDDFVAAMKIWVQGGMACPKQGDIPG